MTVYDGDSLISIEMFFKNIPQLGCVEQMLRSHYMVPYSDYLQGEDKMLSRSAFYTAPVIGLAVSCVA